MNNTRRSVRKTNKVNVSDLAKIICGLDPKKNVKDMTDEQRRNFWCVTKTFGQIVRKYSRGLNSHSRGLNSHKNGGVGMKFIQDFVLAHA